MDPFSDKLSATSFLLEKIQSMAARHGVSFTDFEMRLLYDYHSIPDEELELYDEQGGNLDGKVLSLLQEILGEVTQEGGFRAQRQLKRAIRLAKQNDHYLAGILRYRDTGKSTPLDYFLYIAIALTVVALTIAIAIYSEALSHWFDNTDFGKHYYPTLTDFIEEHFPVLFMTFVAVVAFFGWIIPWLQNRRARRYTDLDEPE